MNGEDVVIGKEYVLSSDYEYWCVELQRNIRIIPGQEMAVKIEHTFQNRVFFGRLIDSQGELEFGPDAIVEEYVEPPKLSRFLTPIIPLNIDKDE